MADPESFPAVVLRPEFDELRKFYAEGELVLFVGAGVSAAAGLPTWEKLVTHLIEQAQNRQVDPALLVEMRQFAKERRYIDALSAAKEALHEATFNLLVERQLEDRQIEPPAVIRAIARLAPRLRAIITTNLDGLLEKTLGRNWMVHSRPKGDLAQRRNVLLKLHGTLPERATWVFTREEYDRLMFEDTQAQLIFSVLLSARPVLFVGFGLVDDDFDTLVGRLRTLSNGQPPRHFALVPRETVRPAFHRRLERAGIHLLVYDNPDGSHTEVVKILEALAEEQGQRNGRTRPANPHELRSPGPNSNGGPSEQEAGIKQDFCPFPGLEVFDESRAHCFFGREADVQELLMRLGETLGKHRRWLHIEGASGCGKSSLARAGLIPAVRQGKVKGAPVQWKVAVLRPGVSPIRNLAEAVYAALKGSLPERWTLDRVLRDFEQSASSLASFLREHLPAQHGFLLVVDQLEEAFTLARGQDAASESKHFDALLAYAIDDKDGWMYLVTTIRSDFMARFDGLPELALRLNSEASRYFIQPMSTPGLRAAIEEPARRAKLEWAPGLPDRILADAEKSFSGLPLVAHVLRELWSKRRGNILTEDAYDEVGGVSGALTRSADRILTGLGDDGRERARTLLLKLVELQVGTGVPRRRTISREEAIEAAGGGAEAERVLARLSGGRDPDKPASADSPVRLLAVSHIGSEQRVDLVHEALIQKWHTLRQWISAKQAALLKARADMPTEGSLPPS